MSTWKQSVASRTPPTGDLARHPGVCPGRESNPQPFGSQASIRSTQPHQPGHFSVSLQAPEVKEETKSPSSSTLPSGKGWGWGAEAWGPNLGIWAFCLSETAAPLSPATHGLEGLGRRVQSDDPWDPQVKRRLARGGPQGAAAAVCWAGSPGDYLFKFQ